MNAGQYNNLAQEMRSANQRLGEIILLLGEINGRMSKEINTPIPDDFPGVKVLHEAGRRIRAARCGRRKARRTPNGIKATHERRHFARDCIRKSSQSDGSARHYAT
jgi:hypothetical protein